MNTIACLIQCQKTADQIKPSVDFHFDVLQIPGQWTVGLSVPLASRMAMAVPPLLQRDAGPPLQILFCSFQS